MTRAKLIKHSLKRIANGTGTLEDYRMFYEAWLNGNLVDIDGKRNVTSLGDIIRSTIISGDIEINIEIAEAVAQRYLKEHPKLINNPNQPRLGNRMTTQLLHQKVKKEQNLERIIKEIIEKIIEGINSGAKIPSGYFPKTTSEEPFPTDSGLSYQDEKEFNALIEELGREFHSQLRIAGHFQDVDGNLQAIYLDDDRLYINRITEEKFLDEVIKEFALNSAESVSSGNWISVEAEAGRGKSCFLWNLHQKLKNDKRFLVLPYPAPNLIDDLGDKVCETVASIRKSASKNGENRFIVIIDTLDILVGIDDAKLSRNINRLRTAGCLLITSSRIQEVEKLYSTLNLNRDKIVRLNRYSDEEFEIITRKYIDKSYPDWSAERKEDQFSKVSKLLEQRREIARALDLEPLVLRMIFEVYVPEDIPQDINTQKVYESFWEKRVLRDRVSGSRSMDERVEVCRMIASEIAFGSRMSHSDTLFLNTLTRKWEESFAEPFPYEILDNLVSSGVLQLATGNLTVRFFHQTFFEYVAAYDLLCSTLEEKDDNRGLLFEDVKNFNFFRVPIIKQLALQDYRFDSLTGHEADQKPKTWQTILLQLKQIDNELAVHLAFEILGKIDDDGFGVQLCLDWINESLGQRGSTVCQSVKHYPRNRIPVALLFLRLFLKTSSQNAVFMLCQNSFAIIAPKEIRHFLQEELEVVKNSKGHDTKTHYKDVLCELLRLGDLEVLEDLAKIFPFLSTGQQKGALNKIASLTNSQNAIPIADFLEQQIFEIISRKRGDGEVWEGFYNAFLQVQKSAPRTAQSFARRLNVESRWKYHENPAICAGKITGMVLADKKMVRAALDNLSATEDLLRLYSSGILRGAHLRMSEFVIDQILSLESGEKITDRKYVAALYGAVSGFENVGFEKIFLFLERWRQVHGTGSYLREIFNKLAKFHPAQTKEWLLGRLRTLAEPSEQRDYFVIFEILAKINIQVFTSQDLREIYDIAFQTTAENRRLFFGLAAWLAVVEESLATEVLERVFRESRETWHTAAIMSLDGVIRICPDFALRQIPLIVSLSFKLTKPRYLQALFRVLKQFPLEYGYRLLQTLDTITAEFPFGKVKDEYAITELFGLLTIHARNASEEALSIIERCPVESSIVSDAMAPVWEKISKYSINPVSLNKALAGLVFIITSGERHNNAVGNSLERAFPSLAEKLGKELVMESVFAALPKIGSDSAMTIFIQAVVNIVSCLESDKIKILEKLDKEKYPQARNYLVKKTLKI
jgi:hypothetical protein